MIHTERISEIRLNKNPPAIASTLAVFFVAKMQEKEDRKAFPEYCYFAERDGLFAFENNWQIHLM